MNSAVASVLNKVLGEFVQDLNASQLNTSILGGDIKLKNLRVKPEALKKFGFPFLMKSGLVGNIDVSIPWRNITSKPLKVLIEDVYVLLEPMPKDQWNQQEYIDSLDEKKLSDLENFELVNQPDLGVSDDPGWASRTVSKIVDNLQIEINRIYIRYEDSYTSSAPFNFGITLTSAKAITCNTKWEFEYVENAPIQFKLCIIEGLGIFFDYGQSPDIFVKNLGKNYGATDEIEAFEAVAMRESKLTFVSAHSWLLSPMSVQLKLKLNRDPLDLKSPQTDWAFELLQPSMDFGLEAYHITHLLHLLEFYSTFQTWQGGVEGSVTYIQWHQTNEKKYREAYKEYRDMKMSKHKKTDETYAELATIERNIKYEDIIVQRKIVIAERQYEEKTQAKEEEIKKIEEEGKEGFFGGFFSRKSEGEKNQEAAERSKRQSELMLDIARLNEQKNLLAQQKESFLTEETLPDEYVSMKISVRLQTITFSLCNDSPSAKMIQNTITGFELFVIMRTASMLVTLITRGAAIVDHMAMDSQFEYFLKSQGLNIRYESNPLNKEADASFRLNSQGALLSPNIESLLKIAGTFKKAMSEKFDLGEYSDAANSAANTYIKSGENYLAELAQGNFEHHTMFIDVRIRAPTLILPYDASDLSQPMIVMDFGNLTVKSTIAPKTDQDLATMTDLTYLYDIYTVEVSQFSLQTVWDCISPEAWGTGRREAILENFCWSAQFANCVTKSNPNCENFKINADVPKLSIRFSDNQVAFLMKFKTHLFELMEREMPSEGDSSMEIPEEHDMPLDLGHLSQEEKQEYLDKIQASQVVLRQFIEFTIGKISMKIYSLGSEFVVLNLEKFDTKMIGDTKGNLDFALSLEELCLTVLKPGLRSHSIANFEIKDLDTKVEKKDVMTANFKTCLVAHYYNMGIGAWEPLLEDWTFKIRAKQESLTAPMDVKFKSKQMMNINLTYAMATAVSTVLSRIDQYKEHFNREDMNFNAMPLEEADILTKSDFHYKIKNRIGVPLICYLEMPASHQDNVPQWTLMPRQSKIFTQGDIETMYPQEDRKLGLSSGLQKAQTIAIRIEGYTTVEGIIIEDVGSYAFQRVSELGTINAIVNIYIQGNEKVLSIQSDTTVMNATPIDIEITTGKLKPILLEGNTSKSLPVNYLNSKEPIQLLTANEPTMLDKPKHIHCVGEEWIKFSKYTLPTTSLDGRGESQVILQLHAPVYFTNLLPCPVELVTQEETSVQSLRIAPGDDLPMYSINPDKVTKQRHFRLQLDTDNVIETKKMKFKFNKSENKVTEQTALSGDYPCNFLSMDYTIKEILQTPDFSIQYRKRDVTHAGAKHLSIYAQYWIVNQTKYGLDFDKEKGNTIRLPGNSAGIFQSKKEKINIRLNGDQHGVPSTWCKSFNITAVGITGEIKFDNSAAHKEDPSAPLEILVGIKILAPSLPLTKTTVIQIVPRYIFKNYLGYPILLKQFEGADGQKLECNVEYLYQFQNSKKKRQIQIGCEDPGWSSKFNIDDIEDFQVKFDASDEDRQEAMKSENSRASELNTTRGLGLLSKAFTMKAQQKDTKWYIPDIKNDYKNFARIVVTTEDDATIYVNFLLPKDPEIMLINSTPHPMYIKQEGGTEQICVLGKSQMPYAYDNQTSPGKKIHVEANGHSQTYNFDKIKPDCKPLGNYQVSLNVSQKGITKEFRVLDPEENEKKGAKIDIFRMLTKKDNKVEEPFIVEANCKLPGISISMIDETPRERLLLTLFGIESKIEYETKPEVNRMIETILGFEIKVNHMQIDNMFCRGAEFNVIFCPSKLLTDHAEGEEEVVPWFQLQAHKSTMTAAGVSTSAAQEAGAMEKYTMLALLIQEIQVKVHQKTILNLLELVDKITSTLSIRELEIQENFVPLTEICPLLDPSQPKCSFEPGNISAKSYFEYVHLSAIKIILDFKTTKQEVSLEIDPRKGFGVLQILTNIGGSLINISDSPINFKELILMQSFQTLDNLMWLVIKNYTRQGVLQFYKILGSVDLIGNPVGLVDKLGSGVFEFFNEPRKGLLKGPKEFVGGIGKGVKSLVTSVFEGSFGSVGKITGSLYSVTRNVGGHEEGEERLVNPDNVFTGVFHGVKGGVMEVAEGVTGIFTKPYEGAKKGGFLGFLKGTGKGILGLALSPFSAALRIGHGVVKGIANTATFLGRGKIKLNGRFRFPRQFGSRRVLEPYHEEMAQAVAWLVTMKDHADEQLVFYVALDDHQMAIMTHKHLILVKNGDRSGRIVVCQIRFVSAYKSGNKFTMRIGGNSQLVVSTTEPDPLKNLFEAIMLMPTRMDPETELEIITGTDPLNRRCCHNCHCT